MLIVKVASFMQKCDLCGCERPFWSMTALKGKTFCDNAEDTRRENGKTCLQVVQEMKQFPRFVK